MFNGIIENLGKVIKIYKNKNREILSIRLNSKKVLKKIRIGTSVAVNGACLSIEKKRGNVLTFSVIAETLKKTNLGSLKKGDRVNIELPLTSNAFISGHIVQGHIDCRGIIKKIIDIENTQKEMWINIPYKYSNLLVYKGAIAVDGVSLTISGVKGNNFKISLIPLTLQKTNLEDKRRGDIVNIEFDYLTKIVKKFKG